MQISLRRELSCDKNEESPNVFQLEVPGLTLLLASWLSWQDLAKFLLHLASGNHGTYGKFLIKILLR